MMTDRSNQPPFHTASRLRELLRASGIAPRRRFGQHFLIDANLMNRLLDAAELSRDDCALEIGAGTGCLTARLAASAGAVVSIEVDAGMHRIAIETVAPFDNVTLLHGDALASKSRLSLDLTGAIQRRVPSASPQYKLVANLPYDIATPLVILLLQLEIAPRCLSFTVQREVAERFIAAPATAAYGPVSVMAQALCSVRRIARVPAAAFWPRPRVESAMLQLSPLPPGQCRVADRREFCQFVRSFFLYRRKRMAYRGRRAGGQGGLPDALSACGIHDNARPQDLSVTDWVCLFDHLS
jgi:16S rRNA (adenine1518-N6/adenine1519-N6)-dimethyltransferase